MQKKKILLFVPIILLFAIIVSLFTPISAYADDEMYEPRFTAPSQSNPYYSSLNYYAVTGTPMPNCAAYAYGRIYEMNGEEPLIKRGNSGEWWSINLAGGYYPYGQEPKLGAVACWSNHVAVVERIEDNGDVTFSESHWGGRYFDTVTYSDVTSHFGQTFYGYFYPYNEGMTQELKTKLLNAGDKKEICTFGQAEQKKSINDYNKHSLKPKSKKTTTAISKLLTL